MSTNEIIEEVTLLPAEERLRVVDVLLQSLNTPDPEIDERWADVAERRLEEIRSGSVSPIPGEEVFARIRERFGHE